MARRNFCGSAAHAIDRRAFLGGAAAAGAAVAADMTALERPRRARRRRRAEEDAEARHPAVARRRGVASWRRGTRSRARPPAGRSARSRPTCPGVHISELMPKMATRMKTTCVIRSLNTKNGDHGGAAKMMMRGRRDEAALRYPDLGAVVAREMGRADSKVPDYVTFYTQTEGRSMAPGDAGFLGARYAPMELTTNNIPGDHQQARRHHRPRPPASAADLRDLLGKQFGQGRQLRDAEQPQRGVPARPRASWRARSCST